MGSSFLYNFVFCTNYQFYNENLESILDMSIFNNNEQNSYNDSSFSYNMSKHTCKRSPFENDEI